MSNLKKIQSEITRHRNNLEKEKELSEKLEKEKIENDISILEKSGVIGLFEEIRDSGLVISRLKTEAELKQMNKFKFFGRAEKKIDYIPAKIVLCTPNKIDNEVSASLEFNHIGWQDDYTTHIDHEEIRIVVVGGELYWASPCEHTVGIRQHKYDCILIQKGKLTETIIEGIKHPLKFGRYSNFSIGQKRFIAQC
jgi:hypothetical protein